MTSEGPRTAQSTPSVLDFCCTVSYQGTASAVLHRRKDGVGLHAPAVFRFATSAKPQESFSVSTAPPLPGCAQCRPDIADGFASGWHGESAWASSGPKEKESVCENWLFGVTGAALLCAPSRRGRGREPRAFRRGGKPFVYLSFSFLPGTASAFPHSRRQSRSSPGSAALKVGATRGIEGVPRRAAMI